MMMETMSLEWFPAHQASELPSNHGLNLVSLSRREQSAQERENLVCRISAEKGVEAGLRKSVEEFARINKLAVTDEGGKLSYMMEIGGRRVELFRTENSPKGIEKAGSLLKEMERAEIRELKSQFGIVIAEANAAVDFQRATSDSHPSEHLVRAHDPRLYELFALRCALQKSATGSQDRDGKPLQLVFLQENLISGINPYATFQNLENGRARLYVWPETASIAYLTEADLPLGLKLSPYDREAPISLERVLVHELAHNTASRLGFETKIPGKPGSELTESGELKARQIGWIKRQDVEGSGEDWLLEGRSLDDNGKKATYLADTGPFGVVSWVRWRSDGGAVDALGKVVPAHLAERLSEKEILDAARVRPASWYFSSPEEMYAEALTLFRLSEDARRSLKENSPELYQVVKDDDQLDINKFYGNGTGMIRLPSGEIVSNTAANRAMVEGFERGAP